MKSQETYKPSPGASRHYDFARICNSVWLSDEFIALAAIGAVRQFNLEDILCARDEAFDPPLAICARDRTQEMVSLPQPSLHIALPGIRTANLKYSLITPPRYDEFQLTLQPGAFNRLAVPLTT